jgi:hypothetical protein
MSSREFEARFQSAAGAIDERERPVKRGGPSRFERLKYLPPTSENISIFGSSEATKPSGSFFGLHPVEDRDRASDVANEIAVR